MTSDVHQNVTVLNSTWVRAQSFTPFKVRLPALHIYIHGRRPLYDPFLGEKPLFHKCHKNSFVYIFKHFVLFRASHNTTSPNIGGIGGDLAPSLGGRTNF